MAYVTSEQVKQYSDVDGVNDDALIKLFVNSVNTAIDTYAKRSIEATSDSTRYFTPFRDTDGPYLYFDDVIASITTVTNGDGVEVTSSQYVTLPANKTPYYGIKILGSAGKAWTYQTDIENAITIVGKWGWATAAPNDVKQAALRWAVTLYRQKDTSVDLDRPFVTDAGVTILPLQMPSDVRQLLKPYRKL